MGVGHGLAQLGDAEIHHLDDQLAAVSLGEKNVVGLEIAMNDSQFVRGVQAVRSLLQDFRAFTPPARPTLLQGIAERFAVQVLHGDIGRAVVRLGGFVDGHDVGVVNAARGTGFVLKSQQKPGSSRSLRFNTFSATGRLPTPICSARKTVPIPPAPRRRTMRKRRDRPAASWASLPSYRREASAILRTELHVVRVRSLALRAAFHGVRRDYTACEESSERLIGNAARRSL